jgi:DNA invertase Pin-like site-specific DNA recombinase
LYNNNILYNIKPEEILIYLRKSRADDPLLSTEEVLANHESILDEWAERNLPYAIPIENRFKEVVSGESISDRMAFQKVLKMVESTSIKAVLVKEISRLGRPDKQEIGYISKIFRYTNTMVITPSRTFNIADEFERKMFEQELEQGNFYLEYNKRILKAGRDLASKKGAYLNLAPFGYDKAFIYEGKRKMSTLSINEEQANLVRMIFEWYVKENIGTQTISNRLNDMGIKPPKINKWKPEAIRDILENPIYIGMIRWNTRKGVYVVVDGEFKKTRPVNKGDDRILTKGLHDPIITEEIFNLAQEKRGRTHRTCDNKKLRNPFASLLFCECGKSMTYRQKKGREPRLVCNEQKYCGNGSCQVTDIIDLVVPGLKQAIAEFKIEAKNGDNEKAVKLHEELIRNLEKKLVDINNKELSLWETQVNTEVSIRMPAHIFQSLADKLIKEREETEQALEKARKQVVKPIDYETKIVTFQKALDTLLNEEATVDEKNQLLKECIERMTYRRPLATRLLGKGTKNKWNEEPIDLDVKLKA